MFNIKLSEGDYIIIDGNIKVYFEHKITMDSISLGIDAPADVKLLRRKHLRQNATSRAEAGDAAAQAELVHLEAEDRKRRVDVAHRRAKRRRAV